ncbi:MAG: phage GP46 family protein [Treponema sp.]|jgi:phage gp46-like protein|nr:phage GP46 family protein [Treponema sp.]
MAMVKIEQWADIRELVQMSIGTNKGTWWADPSFGSDLWLLRQTGKINGQTADTLRHLILQATQWLVSDGLVQEITCQAERSGKNEITYEVTVIRANGPHELLKEVWHAL